MSDFFKQVEELKANKKSETLESKTHTELLQELEAVITRASTKYNVEQLQKELYHRAIEDIKISEWNRIQINKNDFSDKDQVIDILLYTVGKMALDPIFYKMNICKLKEHIPIYTKEAE